MSLGHPQPRDRAGRFDGERLDLERVPTIPANIVWALLREPRTVVLVWVGATANVAEYVVTADLIPGRAGCVSLTALGAPASSARFIRQPLPTGAHRLVWLCPSCGSRTRYLYPAGWRYDALTFTIGCRRCLNLRYQVQGGANAKKALTRRLVGVAPGYPLPRGPLVPTAITSDPNELRRFRNISVAEAPSGVTSGSVD